MKRSAGFTLIELVIIVGIIGILTIIAIPSYTGIRSRAYNASAKSGGRQFVSAQGIYDSERDLFATNMDELLAIDKNLTDAISVTFLWIDASASGYTINVRHASGTRWYTYSEEK